MSPEEAVELALDVAELGLASGEMPIGAVVLFGDAVVGKAYTQERALGRRIVHADLLAMEHADQALGFARPSSPLTLAVNLEPCLMCMGAAITLGVQRVFYALESPNDGAADLVEQWKPPVEQPFFAKPTDIRGGWHRDRSRAMFHRYAKDTGPPGMRRWAAGLAEPGAPRKN